MNHLTPISDAKVLAWHTTEDIQAVRMPDGDECLYVDGTLIPLTDTHHHATQQVINYCQCTTQKQRKAFRISWNLLAKGEN